MIDDRLHVCALRGVAWNSISTSFGHGTINYGSIAVIAGDGAAFI